MTKELPTLSVLLLSNGTHQSATVAGFVRYALITWKTGPGRYEWESQEIHSSKWARLIVAVFPKDVVPS